MIAPVHGRANGIMDPPAPTTPAQADRLQHLEALAAIVYAFVEDARSSDAGFNPADEDLARELRALGFQVRDDMRDHRRPA